jgi:two-component system chemotaxis response regulator CheB
MSIRVVLVDDSDICRAELRDVLEADADIQVVAESASGAGIVELLSRCRPHLLALDLEMPDVNGLTTVEQVMARHPLPILVITSVPERRREASVFEAIRRGALELAQKPAFRDREASKSLRRKVRELSRVRVVRHLEAEALRLQPPLDPTPRTAPHLLARAKAPLVGIVASAGGPTSLVELLSELPLDFRACIAIVQHLPRGFARAFAEFLGPRSPLTVRVVDGVAPIEAGVVYLGADDRHLEVRSLTQLGSRPSRPTEEGLVPSGDILLASLARVFGASGCGIVMSGIGRDGAIGLGALRAKGGLTLAQDAASSPVYGMPRAAFESGAATEALSPRALARAINAWSNLKWRPA